MECDMICFECSKTFVNINILVQHIKHLHPFLQSYICKQNNCHRTFPLLNSFQKHLIKNHIKREKSQLDTT